jgi:hypothetical protein
MYPFLTLEDGTEIVHSDIILKKDAETVRVYIEKPVDGGFFSAECMLPGYEWKNVSGFSETEILYFQELIESVAHIIYRLARSGGFDNAANF